MLPLRESSRQVRSSIQEETQQPSPPEVANAPVVSLRDRSLPATEKDVGMTHMKSTVIFILDEEASWPKQRGGYQTPKENDRKKKIYDRLAAVTSQPYYVLVFR